MIERILPRSVVGVEAFGDLPQASLHPLEALVVRHAVGARRREFATGRWCAKQALAGLQVPEAPLLPGPHHAPRWPEGVVGSITHCAGYRAAAVARSTDMHMLSVDAEPHAPLPAGVLESIALSEELAMVRKLGVVSPGVHWDRLLFSLKETVYKAWYPATRRRLEFEDARITIDLSAGAFSAQVLAPSPLRRYGRPLDRLSGRWLVSGGLLVAALAVPTDDTTAGAAGTVSPAAPRHSPLSVT
ncbi:4'-phosphopantetheinyl transferase superfamily protein [Streptomyces xanthophaeus]|uniref:4'-phosphopantetheinyl transferase family protein n=1 Tax=Streptomyces xanthophaeus TaxID=67385 RepID=UPI00386F3E6A|nr:4'-phosphopantetheinyl transferase superfamily protein [Streptomyces xanthophaeus]WST59232.1 4'-phosphopantetheinyl transferase superfamily protein [Streptomyces xanthophaeus]